MRITTIDPISGNDVAVTASSPYAMEGYGQDALRIYFESEANKQAYLEIDSKTPSPGLIGIYNGTSGSAQEM